MTKHQLILSMLSSEDDMDKQSFQDTVKAMMLMNRTTDGISRYLEHLMGVRYIMVKDKKVARHEIEDLIHVITPLKIRKPLKTKAVELITNFVTDSEEEKQPVLTSLYLKAVHDSIFYSVCCREIIHKQELTEEQATDFYLHMHKSTVPVIDVFFKEVLVGRIFVGANNLKASEYVGNIYTTVKLIESRAELKVFQSEVESWQVLTGVYRL